MMKKVKYALKHKFDELAGIPQLIVEERKIKSEFDGHGVKLQQIHSEMSPPTEFGFEEILASKTPWGNKSSVTARHKNILMKVNIKLVKNHNRNAKNSVHCFKC